MRFLYSVLLVLLSLQRVCAVEPWATYRGNPQRTGNTDGKAGPASPKVLWVLKSEDHFIASPVPSSKGLFVSGLGPFNAASFLCLSMDTKPGQRVLWRKSGPFLKLPSVSSPGIDKGRLVFGDGMHQTNGATLHCLKLDGGLPLWQLPMTGKLVHLEGSPAISEGKVYIGGGAAGVVCVDLERITLEGKEMDLASIKKVLDKRWKELLDKYEIERKKDKLFANPPSEDQLPRANPRRLWQVGQEKWHVDAPVNVIGENVLVCSAFLDKEKVGDRAIYCLDAKTGTSKWRKPLKLNPWGGASVDGKVVVVTGSNIGYDTKALKKSKGMIAAFDLDGKEKWQKDIPASVVSCAALADGLAVVTATDGKVRAFDQESGDRRWIFPGKSPFFAPPAISKGIVYAGDLSGVLHAIDLKTGQERWTLDLGTHKDVMAPGMIYGGPVVHEGKIYVVTCNLEGVHAQKATAVVCIGAIIPTVCK
jgi:outer membrane protein assembly factor BamB